VALHPALEAAANQLGIELPYLDAAAERSLNIQKEATERLRERVVHTDLPLDVLAMGSIARQEASAESDLDYLVISYGLTDEVDRARALIAAADDLCDELALSKPGRTGMFGEVVAASELVERIGLEQDTNLTHSRRILLLAESVSVYQPELHEKLLKSILQRYLYGHHAKSRDVPRFLLNDVVRYWRTMTVDYEAKRWHTVKPEWGLRYLKLISSRKLLCVSLLATLLTCDEATVDHLYDQVTLPPLARIARLAPRLEGEPAGLDALRTVLESAEYFAEAFADSEFRNDVKDVSDSHSPPPDSRFAKSKERARSLQNALETMFLDTELLGRTSRQYLTF